MNRRSIKQKNISVPSAKAQLKEEVFVVGTFTDDVNGEYYVEIPAVLNEDGSVDIDSTNVKIDSSLEKILLTQSIIQ